MNPSNPETGQNPEQRIREEMLSNILQQSEGSVAVYTSMDLSPEERAGMLEVQQSRGGSPAEILSSDKGGWQNYGEQPIPSELPLREVYESRQKYSTPDEYESVFFKGNQDGTKTVVYEFRHPSFKDDTGRPGNKLTVSFTLPEQSAANLSEALHTAPGLINQVVEKQLSAVGLSEDRVSKLKPSEYSGQFSTGRKNKGSLHIGEYDPSTGQPVLEGIVDYNGSESLLGMKAPEVAPEPAQTAEAWQPNPDYTFDQEVFNQTKKATETYHQKQIANMKLAGKSPEEVTEYLNKEIATLNEWLGEETEDELIDKFQAEIAAVEEVKSLMQADVEHRASADTARDAIDQALATQETTQDQVVIDGQQYTVAERYTMLDANKTPMMVVKDANGNEKHVKA